MCYRSPLATCEPSDTQEEALKDFRALYNSRLFADIEIQVDDQFIPCHRAVLAQRCKYFHAMFVSNMQESTQKVVKLSGFSFPVIEAIIKFLYTGVLDIPRQSNGNKNNGRMSPEDVRTFNKDTKFPFLMEVLEASDFYGLSSLHKLCTSELINIMNSDSSNLDLAEQVFNVGLKLEILCLQDQACFTIGKELSRCMLCNHDMSHELAKFSSDLKEHLHHVWEECLQQHPILFGKDRELIDCLTISPPPADEIVARVKELITQGANPENVGATHVLCQHWNVISDSQMEIFKELVEVFVDSGCDMNKLNYSDHSPLHIAARQGRISQVKTLLSLGANPHLKCRSHGYTPLQEIVHGFDEQAAILANSSAMLLSPSRLIALKRSAYNTCQQICDVLSHAMRTRPVNVTHDNAQQDQIELNPYFIDRLFKHSELDLSTRVEFDTDNLGVGRKDLDDTLLEFAYPKFASQLDALQMKSQNSGAAVETSEVKKVSTASLKCYQK